MSEFVVNDKCMFPFWLWMHVMHVDFMDVQSFIEYFIGSVRAVLSVRSRVAYTRVLNGYPSFTAVTWASTVQFK